MFRPGWVSLRPYTARRTRGSGWESERFYVGGRGAGTEEGGRVMSHVKVLFRVVLR